MKSEPEPLTIDAEPSAFPCPWISLSARNGGSSPLKAALTSRAETLLLQLPLQIAKLTWDRSFHPIVPQPHEIQDSPLMPADAGDRRAPSRRQRFENLQDLSGDCDRQRVGFRRGERRKVVVGQFRRSVGDQ
jgi:hypothetical protein